MQKRLKTGCCLVLLYAVFTLISSAVRVVPQVSGLRLEAMLSLPYGLIFGRLGAISAAFGSALALFLVGANLNQIPLEFLAALISAYLPFRVWQGMKSPQEPRLALYDQRTVTMFVILGLLAVAPMAVYPAVGAEIYQVVPFSASFFKILLPTLLFTLAGGFLLYRKASAYFFAGKGEALWRRLGDKKTTTRNMAVAMLRITLTGLFLAAGLALMVPPEFHSKVVEYTMGVFALLLLVMTGF